MPDSDDQTQRDSEAYAKSLLKEALDAFDTKCPRTIQMFLRSDGPVTKHGVSQAVKIGSDVEPMWVMAFIDSIGWIMSQILHTTMSGRCRAETVIRVTTAFTKGAQDWWLHNEASEGEDDEA